MLRRACLVVLAAMTAVVLVPLAAEPASAAAGDTVDLGVLPLDGVLDLAAIDVPVTAGGLVSTQGDA